MIITIQQCLYPWKDPMNRNIIDPWAIPYLILLLILSIRPWDVPHVFVIQFSALTILTSNQELGESAVGHPLSAWLWHFCRVSVKQSNSQHTILCWSSVVETLDEVCNSVGWGSRSVFNDGVFNPYRFGVILPKPGIFWIYANLFISLTKSLPALTCNKVRSNTHYKFIYLCTTVQKFRVSKIVFEINNFNTSS